MSRSAESKYVLSSSLAILLIAGIILATGFVLSVGGAWLLVLGGSPYYLLAGLALVVSGFWLALGRAQGAWLYLFVFVATLLWAWWEVGLNGWALMPRILAPTILLVLLLGPISKLSFNRYGRKAFMILAAAALLAAGCGFVGPLLSRQGVAATSTEPLKSAMGDPSHLQVGSDWPAYGGSLSARRYSPLSQINRSNVSKLVRSWTFHTGDLPSKELDNAYASETTPIKIGDTLYLCTPKNILIALDPETGKQKWRFDPKVADESVPFSAACRGVAYYSVPAAPAGGACTTRIIAGTLDARLIAVDAKNGLPCREFGNDGQVDTAIGMGEHNSPMLSITSAPTIVRGVVVIGHQVLDGQRRDAPSGVIQGYDAKTGQLRWAWDLGRPELSTIPPTGETYTRGTPNMWTTASGDEELGLVYLPLGVSSVDYWSGSRSDLEKKFATSLVALDVTTGKPAWHFQTVHNDVWDYDLGSQATLVDFPVGESSVPALVLPSKRGDIFVLDRRSGEALVTVEERAVPQGGVEPEQRANTQPFSLYHTLQKPDLTEKDMWGLSPIDQLWCRISFRRADYRGIFTPPSLARTIQYPGMMGGSDWGGVAVDAVRGLIIANYNDMPNYLRLITRAEVDQLGWLPRDQLRGRLATGGDPQVGAPYAAFINAGWRVGRTGLPCKQPPYGGIRAIELRSGKTLWDRPLGDARSNGPFGIPSMLPIEIGTPNNGGSVVTAGGLIFIAATTDNLIRAVDIETGETLWKDTLPGGGQATPMTFEINGRQYLTIMAGGHHFMGTSISDQLVAYALPAN